MKNPADIKTSESGMAGERKTTGLLMAHLPRAVALLTESYIMSNRDAPRFSDLGEKTILKLDIAAGHFENLFEYRDQEELDIFFAAACSFADVDTITSLISRGAQDFETALMHATYAENIDCLMYFKSLNMNLTPALVAAIESNNTELAELSISSGADPNAGLYGAVRNDDLEMVRLMISRGAIVTTDIFYAVGVFDFTALGFSLGVIPDEYSMIMAGQRGSLGEIVLFHSYGCRYEYAIIGAIISGRIRILDRIFDRNEVHYDASEFLALACGHREKNPNFNKTVKYLIARGATRCECSRSPLEHLAGDD